MIARETDSVLFSINMLSCVILLPSYISVSVKERCGIFDPMVRDNKGSGMLDEVGACKSKTGKLFNQFRYDLHEMSQRRKANMNILYRCLSVAYGLSFLHDNDGTITPQTVPIVISQDIRNDLYFMLDNADYGVVYLYHTLIDDISATDFGSSIMLSHVIINLPVDQDIDLEEIE